MLMATKFTHFRTHAPNFQKWSSESFKNLIFVFLWTIWIMRWLTKAVIYVRQWELRVLGLGPGYAEAGGWFGEGDAWSVFWLENFPYKYIQVNLIHFWFLLFLAALTIPRRQRFFWCFPPHHNVRKPPSKIHVKHIVGNNTVSTNIELDYLLLRIFKWKPKIGGYIVRNGRIKRK